MSSHDHIVTVTMKTTKKQIITKSSVTDVVDPNGL